MIDEKVGRQIGLWLIVISVVLMIMIGVADANAAVPLVTPAESCSMLLCSATP